EDHVVMETLPKLRQDASGLANIFLRSSTGGLVPLEALVKVVPGNLPLAVNHQGQFPAATVSFNLAPGVAFSEAQEAIEKTVAQMKMPASLRADFAGTARAATESKSSLWLLVLTAILAVYVVLGVLYESYV